MHILPHSEFQICRSAWLCIVVFSDFSITILLIKLRYSLNFFNMILELFRKFNQLLKICSHVIVIFVYSYICHIGYTDAGRDVCSGSGRVGSERKYTIGKNLRPEPAQRPQNCYIDSIRGPIHIKCK